MFPFFESLCVKNGNILNAHWHELRFKHTYQTFYAVPPCYGLLDNICVPKAYRCGTVKLKVSYNKITKTTSFDHYATQKIKRVKLVEANELTYHFKYSNRQALDLLFSQRGACDDILMVKKGLLTDSSSANMVFFDGNQWLTPVNPVLKGTCRARLLANEIITPATITIKSLKHFRGFKLINAMRDMDQVIIPIEAIVNVEC